MSEKRFVILPFNALTGSLEQFAITETELKRRIGLTRHAFSDSEDVEPKYTLDEAIDLLLHGEEQSLCTCGYERLTKCPVHEPPTETREEWKASVRLLHKILSASIFGWPEGELEKAHQMLDEISSMPR